MLFAESRIYQSISKVNLYLILGQFMCYPGCAGPTRVTGGRICFEEALPGQEADRAADLHPDSLRLIQAPSE
jgi:hypothetical protein